MYKIILFFIVSLSTMSSYCARKSNSKTTANKRNRLDQDSNPLLEVMEFMNTYRMTQREKLEPKMLSNSELRSEIFNLLRNVKTRSLVKCIQLILKECKTNNTSSFDTKIKVKDAIQQWLNNRHSDAYRADAEYLIAMINTFY